MGSLARLDLRPVVKRCRTVYNETYANGLRVYRV